MKKNIFSAAIYFFLSTIITWFFIEHSHQYANENKKLLSAFIAGAKWSLQIFAAFVLLKDKKWLFIKNIAFTCFIGAVILLPFCFVKSTESESNLFFGSLLVSIITMILHYRRSVKATNVSIRWYYAWLLCLATAVFLQLKIVFQIL